MASPLREMLTCRQFVEFLDDYLAGRLSRDELARFNEHLAACPSCVAYTKTYRQTVGLARDAVLARGAVPDEAPEDLVRAILRARGA